MEIKTLLEDRAKAYREMEDGLKKYRTANERKDTAGMTAANEQFDIADRRYRELDLEVRTYKAAAAIEFDEQADNDGLPAPGPGMEARTRQMRTERAQETFGKAVRMLFDGKVSKVNADLINEVGGQDARERRTLYPSSNIIQTSVSNDVYFELTTDGNFLQEINRVSIDNGGYLTVPKIERGNYPVAETKAQDAALSGTDLTVTSDTFTPHDVYAFVRYHKNVVRDNPTASPAAIWTATRTAVAKKLHQLCLYGDDSNAGEFDGFDNLTGIQTVAGGSAVLSDYNKITEAAKKLMDKYTPIERMVAVMPPILWKQLADLQETTDAYLDPPSRLTGMRMMTNPEVLETYNTNTETRIYVFDPMEITMALFGNYELTLVERYAEYDHAVAMSIFRADMKIHDVEKLCIVQAIALSA